MRSVALLSALGCVLLGGLAGALPGAAFVDTAGRESSVLTADVLAAPTDFTATRSCVHPAPELVATAQATGLVSTITVVRPAQVLAGDVIVVMVVHHDSSSEPIADPADGWGLAVPSSSSLGGESLMVAKLATASEPVDYSFSGLDPSDGTAAALLVYRGADPADPWAGAALGQANTSSIDVTAPSVTTTVDGARLVTGLLVDDYNGAVTTPTGTSVRASFWADAPQDVRVLVVDRVVAAAGATGTTVGRLSQTRHSHGFTLALRAPQTVTPVTATWTASVDGYATGYEGYRSDDPAAVSTTGPETVGGVDATAGTGELTYYLRTMAGTWRSAWVSATVPAC